MAGARRKWWRGCLIAFGLVTLIAAILWGPLVYSLWRRGVFGQLFSGQDKHAYEGTTRKNLQAMRTALLGYQESEGQFPVAAGWMSAIENRLSTDVLKKGEGEKKMIRPELVGEAGKYGYAFNDAASGKYIGDIKDQKIPLVFESTSTEKNAHGDPEKLRLPGGHAIAVDGTLLP